MAHFRWLSALLLLSLSAPAQSRLLLTSQRDHTFRVFDPVTLDQVSATTESGDAGHELIATRDGKTAFVPIYGNSGVGKPGTDGDHIDVYNIATGKLTRTIQLDHGVRPHKPLWGRDGNLLVSAEIDKAVMVINPTTGKVLGEIPTGAEQSHMITLLPDGKRLYSANVHPGSISVMDVAQRKLIKVIPISDNIQRISCSNDGKWVFTSDEKKPDLVVINTRTNEIEKRIPLPVTGYGSTPTPDGRYLLVALPNTDKLAVIDVKTLTLARTIPTITGLNEIIVSPDSQWIYASSPKMNQLTRINLKTDKTEKTVSAGKYPDGLWLTQ